MDQSNDSLPTSTNLSFESLKKLNQHGVEYWSARDLQPCLGYSHWRDFKNAIKKAIKSCAGSGNSPSHHFADVRKPIPGGADFILRFQISFNNEVALQAEHDGKTGVFVCDEVHF